jgi:hypothetical protein
VGLPALPAYFQARRYTNQREIESKWERRDLLSPNETQLSAPFEGVMPVLDDEGNEVPQPVSGEITLEQVAGRFNSPEVRGIFTGSVNGQMGQTLAVRLDQIGPKIFADPLRTVACDIVDERDGSTVEIGHLKGTVPRSVWDWYEVPVEDATLQTLNKDLGRFFELAQVFTWIAGLLNLLAIWDALEGPAYGYGNELTGSNPGSAENAAGVSATKSPSVESQEAASRLGRAGEQKATVTPPTTGTTAVAATIR